jgi:hypothetical protein
MIRLFGVCLVILVTAGCTNVTVTTPRRLGCAGSGDGDIRVQGETPEARTPRLGTTTGCS